MGRKLGVYPDAKLVLVHRVDTEGEFKFNESSLYRIIRMVFGAKEETAKQTNE